MINEHLVGLNKTKVKLNESSFRLGKPKKSHFDTHFGSNRCPLPQTDIRVTQNDIRVIKNDMRVIQNDIWVTQNDPR